MLFPIPKFLQNYYYRTKMTSSSSTAAYSQLSASSDEEEIMVATSQESLKEFEFSRQNFGGPKRKVSKNVLGHRTRWYIMVVLWVRGMHGTFEILKKKKRSSKKNIWNFFFQIQLFQKIFKLNIVLQNSILIQYQPKQKGFCLGGGRTLDPLGHSQTSTQLSQRVNFFSGFLHTVSKSVAFSFLDYKFRQNSAKT